VSGCCTRVMCSFYDHQTESLWSQLKEAGGDRSPDRYSSQSAAVGDHDLESLRAQHPDTLVLSTQTGFHRIYRRSPYQALRKARTPCFRSNTRTPVSRPRKKVVGVSIGEHHKAYPLHLLREREGPIEDRVGETAVKIVYDAEADSAQVIETKTGKALRGGGSVLFAWATFHPDTPVYGVTPRQANREERTTRSRGIAQAADDSPH